MMRSAIFTALALLVLLATCSKDHTHGQTCGNCAATSFKTDIIPIFTANCALSGCHTGQFPAGHVSLDSAVAYAQATFPGKGYANAGSSGTSIIYLEMIPGNSHSMPPSGLLDSCTAKKIACWIDQGALNN